MKTYIVSVPTRRVVEAYGEWKQLRQPCQRTLMDDGWTLPALNFSHLYEARAAALDLAMVSGSVLPLRPHEILLTEIDGDARGLLP